MPQSAGTIFVDAKFDPRQYTAETNKAMAGMASIANNSFRNVRLPSLATLNKELRGTRAEFNQLTEASQDFGDSLSRGFRRIVALSAASAALFGVARAFQATITAAKDLEKQLQDINVILNLPSKQLQTFGKDLFNIARNTKQSFEEVSKAAVEFARQGLSVEETLKRTNAALILVNLAGVNAKDATETLTAAMNSFNKENLDAVQIVNKIVAVDAKFAVSAADLAESLRRVGSTAQDTGVNFDRLISLTTAAQQVTQRGGSVIGNALKTIFQRLQRSETLDQLEQLGIQVREVDSATGRLTGNLAPADKILRQLAERFKTLNQEQRAQVSQTVAGVYQGNIFRGILNGLTFEQEAYQTAIGATDEALRRNAALLETWDAKYKQAGQTLRQVGANFGKIGFEDISKRFLDAFNADAVIKALAGTGGEVGNEFGKIFIKAFADTLLGIGVAVGPLLVGQISKTLFQFTRGAVGDLIPGLGKEQLTTQKQIDLLLATQGDRLLAINASTLSRTQKEAEILALYKAQNAVLAERAALAASVNNILLKAGPISTPAGKIKARSGGYVPTASDGLMEAIGRESVAIGRGEGGASTSAKPVYLPNFQTGYGVGAVANTSEYLVPNYAGSGRAAIFNREMIREVGMPNGAMPIMSDGFVPNYPGGAVPPSWLFKSGQRQAMRRFRYMQKRAQILEESGKPMIANALREKLNNELLDFMSYMKEIGAGPMGYAHGFMPNYASPDLYVEAQIRGATPHLGLKLRGSNKNISVTQALQRGLISKGEARSLFDLSSLARETYGNQGQYAKWVRERVGRSVTVDKLLREASSEANKPMPFRATSDLLPSFRASPESAYLSSAQTSRMMTGRTQNQIIPFTGINRGYRATERTIDIGGASAWSGPPQRPQLPYNEFRSTYPVATVPSGKNELALRPRSLPSMDRFRGVPESWRLGAPDQAVNQSTRLASIQRVSGGLGWAALLGGPLVSEGAASLIGGSMYPGDEISQRRVGRLGSAVGTGAAIFGVGAQIASVAGAGAPVALGLGALAAGLTTTIMAVGNFKDSIEDTKERFNDLSNASNQRIQAIQNARGVTQSVASALEMGVSGAELAKIKTGALGQVREVENPAVRSMLRNQIISGDFSRQSQDAVNGLVERALEMEAKRKVLSPENMRLVQEEISKGIVPTNIVSGWSRLDISNFGKRSVLSSEGVGRDTLERLAAIRRAQLRGRGSEERLAEIEGRQRQLGAVASIGSQAKAAAAYGNTSVFRGEFALAFRSAMGSNITEKQNEWLSVLEKEKVSGEEYARALDVLIAAVQVETAALKKAAETDNDSIAVREASNRTVNLQKTVLEGILRSEQELSRRAISSNLRRETGVGGLAANLDVARTLGVPEDTLSVRMLRQRELENFEALSAQGESRLQSLVSGVFQEIEGGAAGLSLGGVYNRGDREDIKGLIESFRDVGSIEEFVSVVDALLKKIPPGTKELGTFTDNLKRLASQAIISSQELEGTRASMRNALIIERERGDVLRRRQREESLERPFRGGDGAREAEATRLGRLGADTDYFKTATDTTKNIGERAIAAERRLEQLEEMRTRANESGGRIAIDENKYNAEVEAMGKIIFKSLTGSADDALGRMRKNPYASPLQQEFEMQDLLSRYGTDPYAFGKQYSGVYGRNPWEVESPMYFPRFGMPGVLNPAAQGRGRYTRDATTGQLVEQSGDIILARAMRMNPDSVKAAREEYLPIYNKYQSFISKPGYDKSQATRLFETTMGAYQKYRSSVSEAAGLSTALPGVKELSATIKTEIPKLAGSVESVQQVAQALRDVVSKGVNGTMTGRVILEVDPSVVGILGADGAEIISKMHSRLDKLEVQIGSAKQQERVGDKRPLPPKVTQIPINQKGVQYDSSTNTGVVHY